MTFLLPLPLPLSLLLSLPWLLPGPRPKFGRGRGRGARDHLVAVLLAVSAVPVAGGRGCVSCCGCVRGFGRLVAAIGVAVTVDVTLANQFLIIVLIQPCSRQSVPALSRANAAVPGAACAIPGL